MLQRRLILVRMQLATAQLVKRGNIVLNTAPRHRETSRGHAIAAIQSASTRHRNGKLKSLISKEVNQNGTKGKWL
jgi:hypothetical protein